MSSDLPLPLGLGTGPLPVTTDTTAQPLVENRAVNRASVAEPRELAEKIDTNANRIPALDTKEAKPLSERIINKNIENLHVDFAGVQKTNAEDLKALKKDETILKIKKIAAVILVATAVAVAVAAVGATCAFCPAGLVLVVPGIMIGAALISGGLAVAGVKLGTSSAKFTPEERARFEKNGANLNKSLDLFEKHPLKQPADGTSFAEFLDKFPKNEFGQSVYALKDLDKYTTLFENKQKLKRFDDGLIQEDISKVHSDLAKLGVKAPFEQVDINERILEIKSKRQADDQHIELADIGTPHISNNGKAIKELNVLAGKLKALEAERDTPQEEITKLREDIDKGYEKLNKIHNKLNKNAPQEIEVAEQDTTANPHEAGAASGPEPVANPENQIQAQPSRRPFVLGEIRGNRGDRLSLNENRWSLDEGSKTFADLQNQALENGQALTSHLAQMQSVSDNINRLKVEIESTEAEIAVLEEPKQNITSKPVNPFDEIENDGLSELSNLLATPQTKENADFFANDIKTLRDNLTRLKTELREAEEVNMPALEAQKDILERDYETSMNKVNAAERQQTIDIPEDNVEDVNFQKQTERVESTEVRELKTISEIDKRINEIEKQFEELDVVNPNDRNNIKKAMIELRFQYNNTEDPDVKIGINKQRNLFRPLYAELQALDEQKVNLNNQLTKVEQEVTTPNNVLTDLEIDISIVRNELEIMNLQKDLGITDWNDTKQLKRAVLGLVGQEMTEFMEYLGELNRLQTEKNNLLNASVTVKNIEETIIDPQILTVNTKTENIDVRDYKLTGGLEIKASDFERGPTPEEEIEKGHKNIKAQLSILESQYGIIFNASKAKIHSDYFAVDQLIYNKINVSNNKADSDHLIEILNVITKERQLMKNHEITISNR